MNAEIKHSLLDLARTSKHSRSMRELEVEAQYRKRRILARKTDFSSNEASSMTIKILRKYIQI